MNPNERRNYSGDGMAGSIRRVGDRYQVEWSYGSTKSACGGDGARLVNTLEEAEQTMSQLGMTPTN